MDSRTFSAQSLRRRTAKWYRDSHPCWNLSKVFDIWPWHVTPDNGSLELSQNDRLKWQRRRYARTYFYPAAIQPILKHPNSEMLLPEEKSLSTPGQCGVGRNYSMKVQSREAKIWYLSRVLMCWIILDRVSSGYILCWTVQDPNASFHPCHFTRLLENPLLLCVFFVVLC